MKRQAPNWPKGIVEVPSERVDPRADPGATQRISRALLDDALARTKSGTRPAVRGADPLGTPRYEAPVIADRDAAEAQDAFFGPRDSYADDGPWRAPAAAPPVVVVPPSAAPAPAPAPETHPQPQLLPQLVSPERPVSRRVLALVVAALVVFFAAAATIGFVAGRLTHH
ncbi:MAG: hypothetical protein JWP97_1471 [Labilithrix sp.]|nr:hypothetical protein [Labilithrix sp.]